LHRPINCYATQRISAGSGACSRGASSCVAGAVAVWVTEDPHGWRADVSAPAATGGERLRLRSSSPNQTSLVLSPRRPRMTPRCTLPTLAASSGPPGTDQDQAGATPRIRVGEFDEPQNEATPHLNGVHRQTSSEHLSTPSVDHCVEDGLISSQRRNVIETQNAGNEPRQLLSQRQ
jgi:hypothetical protein